MGVFDPVHTKKHLKHGTDLEYWMVKKVLGVFDGVDEEALEASLCTKTLDDEFVLSSESEALELCKSTEIEDGSYTTG